MPHSVKSIKKILPSPGLDILYNFAFYVVVNSFLDIIVHAVTIVLSVALVKD